MMAVWSEVHFAGLFGGLDFAAEHYHPAKLKYLDLLHRSGGHSVSDVVKPIRQIVTPSPDDPVFDLSAAQTHVLQSCNAQVEDRISTKKVAQDGDVIVSRLRSYLRQVAAIPDGTGRVYLSTEFIVLRSKNEDDVRFLVPYVLSEPVQTVLQWSQDGNEHPRFSENVLLSLPIVPSVQRLAKRLNHLVSESADQLSRSTLTYAEAEMLLESALGLDALDLTPKLFYERPYADVHTAGRFDAEYFTLRMQNLITAVSRDSKTIANVAKLAKRRFKAKAGIGFQYIEIADVTGSGTADSNPVAGEEAPSRATWIVKPGDILATTVRPIRRLSAIISDDQSGYVCSSGFAVLTPKDIAPELLLVYLRLPLVCELLDLHTTASMYPAISTADLMKIPIALPDNATRQKIVAKVRESFDARREARRLLDEAKAIVEEAILGETGS